MSFDSTDELSKICENISSCMCRFEIFERLNWDTDNIKSIADLFIDAFILDYIYELLGNDVRYLLCPLADENYSFQEILNNLHYSSNTDDVFLKKLLDWWNVCGSSRTKSEKCFKQKLKLLLLLKKLKPYGEHGHPRYLNPDFIKQNIDETLENIKKYEESRKLKKTLNDIRLRGAWPGGAPASINDRAAAESAYESHVASGKIITTDEEQLAAQRILKVRREKQRLAIEAEEQRRRAELAKQRQPSPTAPVSPQTAPVSPQTAPISPQTVPVSPPTAPVSPQTAPLSPPPARRWNFLNMLLEGMSAIDDPDERGMKAFGPDEVLGGGFLASAYQNYPKLK